MAWSVGVGECPAEAAELAGDGDRDDRAALAAFMVQTLPSAVQPALREFSAAGLYKQYEIPYHPGALKYFKDHNIKPRTIQ